MSPVSSVAPDDVLTGELRDEELVEHWTILPREWPLLTDKKGPSLLGFAVLLKFYQREVRFPRSRSEIPDAAIQYLARQVSSSAEEWVRYDWQGRTIERHRRNIRDFLHFHEATVEDGERLVEWLCSDILPQEQHPEQVRLAARQRLRDQGIEPPASDHLERFVRSAFSTFSAHLFDATLQDLSSSTRTGLDALVLAESESGLPEAPLLRLRTDPGRPCLETILEEIEKLKIIRSLHLPLHLFNDIAPKLLTTWRRRAAVEELFELRRHPESVRLVLLAAFCHLRGRDITDGLVDLLIDTVHRLGARAERRVERELLKDLRHVTGKGNLLYQLAEVSLSHPDDRVRDVVYPVAGEQTLRDIVREWKASGSAYQEHVQTAMRKSYRSNLRRMLPSLLQILEFRSNNDAHQPVIRALDLIRKYADSPLRTFPPAEDVPIDGIVRGSWQELLLERGRDDQVIGINRLTYEICVLRALREQLRCKEIWVVGAYRYRNPDEDLPTDFDAKRLSYYAHLDLPLDTQVFVDNLKTQMRSALDALDRDFPKNAHVRILEKEGGWISLSPLDAQAEPTTLAALKTEIASRWSMIGLIDMLKESDLRVKFTDTFQTATAREHLDRETLQRRLLLCLYGIGTNTGLKRMGSGEHGVTYKDLQYVRRRFITKEHLRTAIRQVVNATFAIRRTQVWGEGTTACASDSKKFGAWDQNLMTEWHIRYGGPGVMIYWHVERKSSCIYSQLKSCSSSEVAAMIEGVLRHCTTMEVEKNYVDTHGQSEVAFAFCHLLDFQLLPRLKGIHRQRLYRPESGTSGAYPHLAPVLSRPINWELIAQQYDQMVKYTTALKLGTAETESILRRFTRSNVQHPTYRALTELGKAKKTIFLCEYLRSHALRREIHEGLNVIENWNSANSFIFFGKGGEMASNQHEDQELSMLCLHLLQVSLVYVNTLMIQRILTEPVWSERMTAEDLRALTPLIYGHVNPYGTFNLDMNVRLALD